MKSIAELINNWSARCRCSSASKIKLVEMAHDAGYDFNAVGDFVVLSAERRRQKADEPRDQYDPEDIHELAKEMVREGYTGQGLDDEDQAELYIAMAADDPDVAVGLPDRGKSFWRACAFQYRGWKAIKKAKEMRRLHQVSSAS